MQGWHECPIVKLKRDLAQTTDASRRFGMSDIGFDRTNRAELFILRINLESLGQTLDFNRIS
ncbi:hypothetical protein D3C73_443410 [compost metagenome]